MVWFLCLEDSEVESCFMNAGAQQLIMFTGTLSNGFLKLFNLLREPGQP